MNPRLAATAAALGIVIGSILCSATPTTAQIAGLGDVYYKVHVDHRYQFGPFVDEFVPWENRDLAGPLLIFSAAHDTVLTFGSLGTESSLDAVGGVFTADLDSHVSLEARTGAYSLLFDQFLVDVYVKGNTGTPFWLSVKNDGNITASRIGGLPGTLQPLNGTSTATFNDTTAAVDFTGSISKTVDDSSFVSGFTTTSLVVGADTYSFARHFTFRAPTSVTQAFCILGCMAQAAQFNAVSGGHVELRVFTANPVDVPIVAPGPGVLAIAASPNPLVAETAVSFRAGAGERTRVDVFDVRGRRVAALFDGFATGGPQRLTWDAGELGEGLYFLAIRAGSRSTVAKLTRLR